MSRTKKTFVVIALMGILIAIGSFGNKAYAQETELQGKGLSSGVYIASVGKASGDKFFHAYDTIGSDAIGPSLDELPVPNEPSQNSPPVSSFETTWLQIEPTCYVLDPVEEETKQHFCRNFDILDAPHDDIDSTFGVNILTIDTEGNLTGISKKIVEMIF